MIKLKPMTPTLGMVALLAATMIPATARAGEETRAVAAIAEASGKIDAGDKVGAADQAPDLQRRARQALMNAQDLLSHHQKVEALAAAQQASDLADQAIVVANRRKTEAERDRTNDQRDAATRAQQSAAMSDTRANSAEAATTAADARAATAEQAATTANMRAAGAEQSSAVANAQLDAIRNAPPPAPTTTTVAFTERDTGESAHAPVHHPRHRVVHHTATHMKTDTVKTDTAVVTTNHR